MTEEYKIRINRKEAIEAYLAEINDNRGNGHYKIDVEPGLFKLYNRDVWDCKPHFTQAGNYYSPEIIIDEFGIREYFDEDEILSHDSDIGYIEPGTPDNEIDDLTDYWHEIVGAAVRDHIETENGERKYLIEWI